MTRSDRLGKAYPDRERAGKQAVDLGLQYPEGTLVVSIFSGQRLEVVGTDVLEQVGRPNRAGRRARTYRAVLLLRPPDQPGFVPYRWHPANVRRVVE